MSSSFGPREGTTAIDLVSSLDACLEPKPAAIRLLPFLPPTRSNMVKFLEEFSASFQTVDARIRTDDGSGIALGGRETFARFAHVISSSLSKVDQSIYGAQLRALEAHYDLSYGSLVECMCSAADCVPHDGNSESLKVSLEKLCRDSLMDHTQKDSGAAIEVGLHDLRKGAVQVIVQEMFSQASQSDRAAAPFVMLMSGTVMNDGTYRFIPMLDFRLSISNFNCDLVEALIRAADCAPGAIVESGRSYHYYGFRLMSLPEVQAFAHLSLLMTPFVDSRYLGHRLLGGEFSLRISGRGQQGAEPKVRRIVW